jgi:hypothetical protein
MQLSRGASRFASEFMGNIAPDPNALSKALLGAPLDAIKTIAAITMCLESANFILFENRYALLWYADRWTFPLFSFALAIHIARGFEFRPQVASLLVLGVLTQPFHAAAFPDFGGANVMVTLAIGATLAGTLATRPAWMSDAVLALSSALAVKFPEAICSGWEYGLLGAMLPVALTSALSHAGPRLLWPIVVIATLYLTTDFGRPPWPGILGLDIAVATVGAASIVALCSLLRGRRRFLHRYALHVVYPGHFALLVLVRAAGLLTPD